MRYFNNHRRKLIKKKFIRGTKTTVESNGEASVKLVSTTNLPLCEFEIEGNTIQKGVPSLDNQIPIENAGDNGINLTVRGINLFDAIKKDTKSAHGLSLLSENNIFYIEGVPTQQSVNGILYKVDNLKPNVSYTFRLKKMSGGGITGGTGFGQARFYVCEKFTYKKNVCYMSINGTECVGTYTFTEEHISNGVYCGVYFNYSTETEFDNYSVRADIVEGEYTLDTFPEYEPYIEPVVISVPTRTWGYYNGLQEFDTLYMGREQTANMYGDEVPCRDKMFIEKGLLKYQSCWKKYILTGEEEWKDNEYVYSFKINEVFSISMANCNLFMCNSAVSMNLPPVENACQFDAWTETVGGDKKIHAVFTSPTLTGSEIRKKIKELYDAGTPVIMYLACLPVVIDITESEIGKAILGLSLPENATIVIEASSAIPVNKIKVSYYSNEKEDKYSLTVHYRNEKGVTLLDSKVSLIRCNSKYIVIAPEIEGYFPLKSKYEGYLTQDSEITIKYTIMPN